MFKRLKNSGDNLAEVDNNDNKVGILKIIKDIKDKAIKIDNNDEAIREIGEHINELIDDGVKVNNFDEMKEEIMERIQNLEKQGIDVKTNIDEINNLIDKIFDKNKDKNEDLKIFLVKYPGSISTNYGENKFSTKKFNKLLIKYYNKNINPEKFIEKYNEFKNYTKNFEYAMNKKKPGAIGPNQKEMLEYYKELDEIIEDLNPKAGSGINKKVKILTKQQMLSRLPILLAQIQAGNISQLLKNELRQLIYSLYRSKALTKTVYNNLVKVI